MTSFKMTVCIKVWNNFFKILLFCIPIQLIHFDCVNGFLNSIKEIIWQTEAIYCCPSTFIISISNQCVNIGGGDVKRGKPTKRSNYMWSHNTHEKNKDTVVCLATYEKSYYIFVCTWKFEYRTVKSELTKDICFMFMFVLLFTYRSNTGGGGTQWKGGYGDVRPR